MWHLLNVKSEEVESREKTNGSKMCDTVPLTSQMTAELNAFL